MRRLLLLALACACSRGAQSDRLADGGAFVLPDSGRFYDSGPAIDPGRDAGTPDSGPAVCNPACTADRVCACVESGAGDCGCHSPRGYRQPCDPQVAASCRHPFDCVLARVDDDHRFICSDGREGTPCARAQASCNTASGCVCLSTPFGTSCTCQGVPGPSPLLCDPMVPATCPNGTCVRVEAQSGAFWVCSDGSEHEYCNPGDGSCRTSLGCTCPLVAGRRSCRCTEPGDREGDACDPSVMGVCVAPLRCEIRGNPVEGGYFSECKGMAGGNDAFRCDPARPMCPQGFMCVETEPGVYRCRP